MFTLLTVLAFPILLFFGYGLLYSLSGRTAASVTGPPALLPAAAYCPPPFPLYPPLLAFPPAVLIATHPTRITESLTWQLSTFAWLPAGLLLGFLLWSAQRWALPGKTPDASERIWTG